MKFVKIFTLLIAAFSISFNSYSQTTAPAPSEKKTVLKVKGVTCSNDLKTIAGNVEKLKGVTACVAAKPGATTKFEVKYNPALVSEKEIHAAIENTEGCSNPNDRPYKVKP